MPISANDLVRRRIALELAQMQVHYDCLPEERENRRDRLLEQAKAGRSSLWRSFLLSTGDVLISSGLWLKSRCQPALAPSILEAGWQR